MNTPICDFVQNYISRDASRFHMPGHKGASFLGCEPMDITEIGGADVLYSPDGIIAESENNATALFGSAHSFYSAEGSSLAIRAMLGLLRLGITDRKPLVLAARNAHKTFIYACALLDLHVEWLCPERFLSPCDCNIPPHVLQKRLSEMPEKPDAVYVTSPDYLGNIADVRGLSKVCDRFNIPLFVDNAHGAYLRFLEPSLHPLDLGAAVCCDSAHKTLPVLTGGAYLHISKKAPAAYLAAARKYLSLFASTSPSYLILASLDRCNAHLADGYGEKLAKTVQKLKKVATRVSKFGFCVLECEPLKLVINAKKSGYRGDILASLLSERNVECEFADPDYLVLMVTPETRDSDLERLVTALAELGARPALPETEHTVPPISVCLTPREAIFAPSEAVPVKESVGRICAAPTVACPPAVPIVISGERISESHVRLMQYYGHESVDAVK